MMFLLIQTGLFLTFGEYRLLVHLYARFLWGNRLLELEQREEMGQMTLFT